MCVLYPRFNAVGTRGAHVILMAQTQRLGPTCQVQLAGSGQDRRLEERLEPEKETRFA